MKNMTLFNSEVVENIKKFKVKTEDFIFYTTGVDILKSIQQSEHNTLTFSEVLGYSEVDEIPFSYKVFMSNNGSTINEISNMNIITKIIQSGIKNVGDKVELLAHRRFVYTIYKITDTHVYFTVENFSREWSKR